MMMATMHNIDRALNVVGVASCKRAAALGLIASSMHVYM